MQNAKTSMMNTSLPIEYMRMFLTILLQYILSFEIKVANSLGIPMHPFINAPDPDVGELITGVVGAFVVIVVGVNLVGPTATTVGGAIKSGNVTAIGGLVSILQVTVLIFGIIVLVAAVVFISVITNKAKNV